ncbi:hypothetical protein FOWG_18138 [Fusarium oxysporum f. sp. lycopersici MN25]|nr:hypothetical protein FOWG_18138 [Fusarium oxysporum f. sp. lycopersici MN25]
MAAFFRKNYAIDGKRMRQRVDGERLTTLSVDTGVLWCRRFHMFIHYLQMRQVSCSSSWGLKVG